MRDLVMQANGKQSKWIAALFLLLAFSVMYIPLFKFPYTFCTISVLAFLFTWLQDGNIRVLQLKKFTAKDLLITLLAYIVLECSMDFIVQPAITKLFNEPADYSAFTMLKGNTGLYVKWLLLMWLSAAFGEELFFRSYIIAQLQRILGNKPVLHIVISAALFAVPHIYQGVSGAITTFVFGIAFGFIYVRWKNCWINVLVHGLIDTVFLTLSYLGLTHFYGG
ncbi:CPBP family intramembrane metalloprotease [Lacibacter luteus]|uniref:CPBP family intramembrane metalloprotease n=1 Tax=Lacibacter luteus TaxID=2508719 RepID=A0A4Q1CIX5_9BACT|nr:type II CAAX endopeptidase family protein [Lacibacter luteus]RXK60586.1 CPBP family intramembrane metalloprotease [Lacibacter luteus]